MTILGFYFLGAPHPPKEKTQNKTMLRAFQRMKMLVIVVPCGRFVFQNVLQVFFFMLCNATTILRALRKLYSKKNPRRSFYSFETSLKTIGWKIRWGMNRQTDRRKQPCKCLNDWWILKERVVRGFHRCKIISFVRYAFLVFFSQQLLLLLLGFFFKRNYIYVYIYVILFIYLSFWKWKNWFLGCFLAVFNDPIFMCKIV